MLNKVERQRQDVNHPPGNFAGCVYIDDISDDQRLNEFICHIGGFKFTSNSGLSSKTFLIG